MVMTYKETIEYLYGIPQFQNVGSAAYKPGLETALAFDNDCGNPARRLKCIHIAGTNGKGSTASMIYYALRECGFSTGLFTSPHLKDFRERIEVDGKMISENEVVEFIQRERNFIENRRPSFFEVTSAMAFDHFARHNVDWAVVETGLGGRLDSTNIITPAVSVITNISMDHMAILGNTLPKIALEKAGIIKPGIPVVIGEYQMETAPIFMEKASHENATLTFAEDLFSVDSMEDDLFNVNDKKNGEMYKIRMTLSADYQKRNIVTAMAALSLIDGLAWDQIVAGIGKATIRGRWQILGRSPLTVCDTGHNPAGIRYVADQLKRVNYRKLYFVLGIVGDKDFESISDLLPKDAYYLFTQSQIPRALPYLTLAKVAASHGLMGEPVATIREAFDKACLLAGAEDMIFVGGSTYTVAELPTI